MLQLTTKEGFSVQKSIEFQWKILILIDIQGQTVLELKIVSLSQWIYRKVV